MASPTFDAAYWGRFEHRPRRYLEVARTGDLKLMWKSYQSQPRAEKGRFLAHFDVAEFDLESLHKKLEAHGVAFHTLEPLESGARVIVSGEGQEQLDKVNLSAEYFGVTGTAEFIDTTKEDGTDGEQRYGARRIREGVIAEGVIAEESGGQQLAERDLGSLWQEIRDRWGKRLQTEVKEPAPAERPGRRGYPEYDPNQPRDEAGRFGSGGGGAESAGGKAPGKAGGKPKGKGKAKKEDFEKAGVKLYVSDEEKFLGIWNEKVGIEPEQFKKDFLGGVDSTMTIEGSSTGKFLVGGNILDKGRMVGQYNRNINLDDKSAYSAFFKIEKAAQKGDIGKKVLAGNVAMYESLGIEKVSVTANIDVGGYAWAKYGYVPTTSAWNALRASLLSKVGATRGTTTNSGNTVEAEEWGLLNDDQQQAVEARWMEDSFSEFLSSEQDNWRSERAPDEAAQKVAAEFYAGEETEWATDELTKIREERAEAGKPPIPFTDEQLIDAILITEPQANAWPKIDADIKFDDSKLTKPTGFDPDQPTLPGIKPVEPHEMLTAEMRADIRSNLGREYEKRIEEVAENMEPPDYLRDSVAEYQSEYWSSMDDSDRLSRAIEYGLADVELPEDEDEDEDAELDLPPPASSEDPLLTALRDSNPKSIWKVADHPRGKSLLLGTNWGGILSLKDKESMERFRAYVGKRK